MEYVVIRTDGKSASGVSGVWGPFISEESAQGVADIFNDDRPPRNPYQLFFVVQKMRPITAVEWSPRRSKI